MTVPVVILTGFLGAGKTTLLNRMIAERAARGDAGKIGIIVNELGAVGVDGALLPAEMTRQVELPGGCICCTLSEDLDRTILDMLAAYPEIERLVIETTGVAEPISIAWAIEREPLASRVRLAAVVTLVDVENFLAERTVSPAVDAQVAYADLIVLTKTDLRAHHDDVIAAVRQLAPQAQLLSRDDVLWWLRDVHTAAAADHDHHHDHGIDAVVVPVDGIVDVEELEDALAELPGAYVRIKGLVRDADGWVAVHRVGLRVSHERVARAPAGLTGRIVALGAGVAREPVAACVERAVVS